MSWSGLDQVTIKRNQSPILRLGSLNLNAFRTSQSDPQRDALPVGMGAEVLATVVAPTNAVERSTSDR